MKTIIKQFKTVGLCVFLLVILIFQSQVSHADTILSTSYNNSVDPYFNAPSSNPSSYASFGDFFTASNTNGLTLNSWGVYLAPDTNPNYNPNGYLQFGIAAWTGTAISGPALWSENVLIPFSTWQGEVIGVTIPGGLNLVDGQQYIAYVTSYGSLDINGNPNNNTYEVGLGDSSDPMWSLTINQGDGSPFSNQNWVNQTYWGSPQFAAGYLDFSNPSSPVPEPGTLVLIGIGMAGLAVYGKRRAVNKD